MNPATYLGVGAVLAFAASAWQQAKHALGNLAGLLVVKETVYGYHDGAAVALLGHLRANYKHRRLGPGHFFACRLHVAPLARRWPVVFEYWQGDVLFWAGWRPFLVSVPCWPMTYDMAVTVRSVRGTVDVAAITKRAVEAAIPSAESDPRTGYRFCVRRFTGGGRYGAGHDRAGFAGKADDPGASGGASVAQIDKVVAVAPEAIRAMCVYGWADGDVSPLAAATEGEALDLLSLSADVLVAVEDVRRWLGSREWYQARSIPWRHGLLFHGGPGNGKTSVAVALARDLDLPVLLFDLTSMSNEVFLMFWGRLVHEAPCVALFEDLDAVFDGRVNVAGEQGGGLTFDCLLNALGGADVADGVLTVITTNKPAALDPALASPCTGEASRPGRVDRVVEVGPLDAAGYAKIAARILRDTPDAIDYVVGLAAPGESGAVFMDRCRRTALENYWADRPAAPAPEDA